MSMTSCTVKSTRGPRHSSLFLFMLSGLVALSLHIPAPAQADISGNCFVTGQATIDFGTVDPGDGATANDSMTFGCSATASPPADIYVRICVYIGEDPRAPGYLPRHMVGDSSQNLLAYDLYYDPAHTHLISTPGSRLPPDTWMMSIPASSNGSPVYDSFPIYGRLRSGQQGVAVDRYQSHPQGSQFKYYFSTESSIPVLACNLPEARTASLQFGGVYAQVIETCRITTASDMDFGQVSSLSGGREQVSNITMSCPQGMAWQVGLDNGANATGTTRRMAGPTGNFIHYELYRDAARTQRWGNTLNSDTSTGTGQGNTTIHLPVYGRIEEQPANAGIYRDTITVTLTF